MAYEYSDRVVESWDWPAQCAVWRERALHQAQRAEHFKAVADALKNGTTVKASSKEPAA